MPYNGLDKKWNTFCSRIITPWTILDKNVDIIQSAFIIYKKAVLHLNVTHTLWVTLVSKKYIGIQDITTTQEIWKINTNIKNAIKSLTLYFEELNTKKDKKGLYWPSGTESIDIVLGW